MQDRKITFQQIKVPALWILLSALMGADVAAWVLGESVLTYIIRIGAFIPLVIGTRMFIQNVTGKKDDPNPQ